MDWNSLTLFLMITGRMTGFVVFNPLLGRRGVPNLIKAGFVLLLSLCVFSMTAQQLQMPATLLGLAFTFLMELFLGYVLGLIVNLFFYIPLMAGSVIDMQMGLSMASTYDPASGIQVTATGQVALGNGFYGAMIQIFIDCTLLGVKLCMPVLAAELMGQVGMGILMKVIPQINVFAINIELKVIVGLVMVMLLMNPFSDFLLNAEAEMLLTLQRILPLMSG